MKFVTRFGGGLGDIFMKLYEHKLYNSLLEFRKLGDIDAVVCCSNPASKPLLESLNIFSNILHYDWEMECTHMEDYMQKFPRVVNLYTCGAELFKHLPLTSFGDGNMHHYKYHLNHEEITVLDSIKDLEYIALHSHTGTQSNDGLTQKQYAEMVGYVLDYMPSFHVVDIGANHQRIWVDSNDIVFDEYNMNIEHPRFIDLKNRTSCALSANIVENANAFIGTHSAWINLFWFLKRPTVCIYGETNDWGNWMDYQLTNGCKWGFYTPWTKTIPIGNDVNVESVAKLASDYLIGGHKYVLTR